MDAFKRKLKIQIFLLLAGSIFLPALLFAIQVVGPAKTESQQSFIGGIFFAAEALVLALLFRFIKAYRNPSALKKLYISQTDERKITIQQKSLSASFRLLVFGLGSGVLLSLFINFTVFVTLSSVLLFLALAKLFFMAYYSNKT